MLALAGQNYNTHAFFKCVHFEFINYSKFENLSANSCLPHLAAPLTLRLISHLSSVALRRRVCPSILFCIGSQGLNRYLRRFGLITAYSSSAGLTMTQFLSAVTGRPSAFCLAACSFIMLVIVVMCSSLRLTQRWIPPFSTSTPWNSM